MRFLKDECLFSFMFCLAEKSAGSRYVPALLQSARWMWWWSLLELVWQLFAAPEAPMLFAPVTLFWLDHTSSPWHLLGEISFLWRRYSFCFLRLTLSGQVCAAYMTQPAGIQVGLIWFAKSPSTHSLDIFFLGQIWKMWKTTTQWHVSFKGCLSIVQFHEGSD